MNKIEILNNFLRNNEGYYSKFYSNYIRKKIFISAMKVILRFLMIF